MICINRFREGSDIPHVDCGIYLDAVKKRSILVAMQTSGRICRPDIEGNKKRAIIVDTFVNTEDKTVEIMTLEKILDYYRRIITLTKNKKSLTDMKKLYKLYKNMQIDQKEHEIRMRINDNPDNDTIIKLNYIKKNIDWGFIVEKMNKDFDEELKRQFEIDEMKRLLTEYEVSIDFNKERKITTKDEYVYHIKFLNLRPNPEKYFAVFWTDWYDYLGLDKSGYPKTYTEFTKLLEKNKIKNVNDYYKYMIRLNLPEMPEELYREVKGVEIYFKTYDKFNKTI